MLVPAAEFYKLIQEMRDRVKALEDSVTDVPPLVASVRVLAADVEALAAAAVPVEDGTSGAAIQSQDHSALTGQQAQ